MKISRLLFADGLVQLSSTNSGLQRALNSFADACNTAEIEISTAKTEVLHLSKNPDQCLLQVNGTTLKQVKNKDGSTVRYASIFAKKYGTMVRCVFFLYGTGAVRWYGTL